MKTLVLRAPDDLAKELDAQAKKTHLNHPWAIQLAQLHPPPRITCESVLSEADHLLILKRTILKRTEINENLLELSESGSAFARASLQRRRFTTTWFAKIRCF